MAAMFAGTLLSQLRVLANMVEPAAREVSVGRVVREEPVATAVPRCPAAVAAAPSNPPR